jgi:hypothetical protein
VARYLSVALFFALGLLAKPMIITLPFLLLLADYWPLERLGMPEMPGINAAGEPVCVKRPARWRSERSPYWVSFLGSSLRL